MLTLKCRMSRHTNQLSGMTAAWLLPIVSTIVAAASGGIVASVLQNEQHALWTIIISYILWGTGVPLAMMVLVMYFHRLTIHKLPPREVIVSVFLPLGPLGQGSFGIMQLGKEAMRVFPQTNSVSAQVPAGTVLYIVGFMIGLIMWGFALVWLFFALATIRRSKFPFNMGWWGFTFPIGVFTVSTTTLAKELPSLFFKVLGTVSSLQSVSYIIASNMRRFFLWQSYCFGLSSALGRSFRPGGKKSLLRHVSMNGRSWRLNAVQERSKVQQTYSCSKETV